MYDHVLQGRMASVSLTPELNLATLVRSVLVPVMSLHSLKTQISKTVIDCRRGGGFLTNDNFNTTD